MENKEFADYVGKVVDVSTKGGGISREIYIGKVTEFNPHYVRLYPYLNWDAVWEDYVLSNIMTLGIGRKRRREQLRNRLESLKSANSRQEDVGGILIPREKIEYIKLDNNPEQRWL